MASPLRQVSMLDKAMHRPYCVYKITQSDTGPFALQKEWFSYDDNGKPYTKTPTVLWTSPSLDEVQKILTGLIQPYNATAQEGP